ncbi:DUF5518 domain-containing protein [Haloplanus rubicundus]|uniref:DUF5518 domain-containing protein n=1 Tax=Haloplanus rubicundus TaxID=1547898 RepID=A0A345EFI0_9EURY|nr:DUF5518 domain-containing protein [Haloplanus rubicundus]AXG10952.1 hypothetical protein DU484_14450 [Haloplanus rubicundus]
MARIGPIPEPWRYALLGGLLALPGTAYLYWQSGTELSVGPVLLGGVVAGYLYRGTERRRVGVRTGLIGGLPALWMLADALAVVPGVGGPAWFRVAAGGMGVLTMLLFTLLAFALAAVAGVVGAAVGDWLSEKTGRRRSSPADG